MVLKALLGPHKVYEEEWQPYKLILEAIGYKVNVANSVENMLKSLGIQKNSPLESPPENHYDFILMEIDQGFPFKETYESASTVYRHVKADAKAGRTKYIAISEMNGLVKSAKSAGIPAMSKDEFDLEEIRKLVNNQKP